MFDDIRPYRDDEVAAVLTRLINQQGFQAAIAKFKLPRLYQTLPKLACLLVKWSLKVRAKKLHNIEQIQVEVSKYLHHLIKQSTTGFSFSGMENVDASKPSLFISNHRDIVLDVALVNLALYQNGNNTVEAAVGDNLLHQPWVADLMRINKSFIVKRNEENKRAMLKASKQLSSYIYDTVANRQQNIWIAQREGRAKDGIDKTNAALISMLLLNKNKQTPIADYLEQLNIVPVSISYEFDPCDSDKAIELAAKEATGCYTKQDGEDLKSITQGLVGQKGRVHIEFCPPIKGDYADSKAIATAIDKEIISNYKLYDSNLVAHATLNQQQADSSVLAQLNSRMASLNAEQQHCLLTMYANPVAAKQAL
ncbi:MAG: 1-acyl-sn-glycerol-3-phosphate acyltransferase [Cognaticolwellia sp.]